MGCSNCGQIGHNLKTCKGKGKAVIMLFGVDLLDDKPAKQGQDQEQQQCCHHHHQHHQKNATSSSSIGAHVQASDNVVATNNITGQKRKRDGPWTEEEHQRFLLGLKELGKGEWAGIAKEFVLTRDSRQVASHGQKYFKRLAPPSTHMKRRHSIFDLSLQHQGSAADTNLPNTTITESKTSSQVGIGSTTSATAAAPLKDNNSSQALHVVDQIPNLGLENNPHAHALVHDGPIMFAPGSYNYNTQSPTSYPIYYQWMTHPSIYQPYLR